MFGSLYGKCQDQGWYNLNVYNVIKIYILSQLMIISLFTFYVRHHFGLFFFDKLRNGAFLEILYGTIFIYYCIRSVICVVQWNSIPSDFDFEGCWFDFLNLFFSPYFYGIYNMFYGAPVRVSAAGPTQWHTSIDSFALQGLSCGID